MSTSQNAKDTKTTSANASSKMDDKKMDSKKTDSKSTDKDPKSNSTKK
jgi:hypothetical protein